MKFTLSWLFLEITLICIWLAAAFTPMSNWYEASFSEFAFEIGLRTVAFFVSGGAVIGGLRGRPVAGALVGLALSVLVTPMVIIGTAF